MDETTFVTGLPVERRLALAYAPVRAKALWLGLFVLDQRLAGVVAGQREAMLAQIKLAWWRAELAKPAGGRSRGEPVLALLDSWGDHAAGLQPLVDSWELLLDNGPLSAPTADQVAALRGEACRALAVQLGHTGPGGAIDRAARGWALADLAARTATSVSAAQHDWQRVKLPRDLRPLAVLYGLARHGRGKTELLSGPRAALRAVRLGILGI